jgi:hypothetical protein
MQDEPTTPRPRHLHIALSPLERTRLYVEIAAFLAAGIWGVYTFVYQTHIAPMFETGHEVVTGDVTRIGTTPTGYIERVNITILNDGPSPVDTAATAFNLYGLRDDHLSPAKIVNEKNITIAEEGHEPDHWTLIGSFGDLRASAITGDPDSHIILNPNDSAHIEFLAIAPRGRFTALRLLTDTLYVRYPFASKIPVGLKHYPDGSFHIAYDQTSGNGFPVSAFWYFPI